MSTMTIDAMNRRVYMAGLSLAQFIGYENTEDFCRHTVLIVGDISADRILHFSGADCGAGEVAFGPGDAGAEASPGGKAPLKWSAYWAAAVKRYVPAEYRPQVERFFSCRYMKNLYERGGRQDSLEHPCIIGDGQRWVRTTYQLEPTETGHIQATTAVIDISRFRENELRLTNMATRDGLTGLTNRVTAQEQITAALAAAPDSPAAIAVIDIDNFKQINDRYGHEHGDRILLNFADELQEYFASDVLVSRTGGDEFLLFFPDTEQEQAEQLIAAFAEKEHFGFADERAASDPADDRPTPFYFYASIGYAMYPSQGTDYEQLAARADEAMYAAKVSKHTHHMLYNKESIPSHRSGMGFSLRDLAGGMPAGVMVCRADEDRSILFANPELVRMLACEDEDDLMDFTGGRFAAVMESLPAERAQKAPAASPPGGEAPNRRYRQYRIRSKTGEVVNVEEYTRLLATDHYGEVQYAVLHDMDRIGK